MSVYKQFTTKDVVITPFNLSRGFSFTGNQTIEPDVGIEFYTGFNNSSLNAPFTSSGIIDQKNTLGVYRGIKQLYYSNYLSSSWGDDVSLPQLVPGVTSEDDRYVGDINSPRYDNYLQSTLIQQRYFPTASNSKISVISIPSKLFGDNIVPSTFEFKYTSSLGDYYNVKDDGNGNLISGSDIVGQIFYAHGLGIFTTSSLSSISEDITEYNLGSYPNLNNVQVSFSSSFTIYENEYKCSIGENEFKYSLNPTLISGSNTGVYKEFVTGSHFVPYVTTIGLYNDNKELMVIGKLSHPIPLSKYNEVDFIINFDT